MRKRVTLLRPLATPRDLRRNPSQCGEPPVRRCFVTRLPGLLFLLGALSLMGCSADPGADDNAKETVMAVLGLQHGPSCGDLEHLCAVGSCPEGEFCGQVTSGHQSICTCIPIIHGGNNQNGDSPSAKGTHRKPAVGRNSGS
jgi:hypothetical protein